MSIFPQIKHDSIVQVLDQVRFDLSKTLVAKPDVEANIDTIEFSPDGYTFIEVKGSGQTLAQKDWFFDWVYENKKVGGEDNQSAGVTNNSSFDTILEQNAQTYTIPTGITEVLGFKAFVTQGSGAPVGSVVVDIVEGTPDVPGALLATSESIDIADLPAIGVNDTPVTFLFDSVVTVTPGAVYHFIVRPDVISGGFVNLYYPAGDTYAGGSRWTTGDGGASWTSQPNDLSFVVLYQTEATNGDINPIARFTATDGRVFDRATSLTLVTEAEDYLFSSDVDLVKHEEEIFKFLPKGRSSFIYKHRRAQELILEDFNERGVTNTDNEKLTKADFVDIEEVRDWSIALTLSLIFADNSNVIGDTFSIKAEEYNSAALRHRDRAFTRVDLDGDGIIDKGETVSYQTKDIVRS